MRALLDANLFISYLLSLARTASAVVAILDAAATGRFTLLSTPGLSREIRDTVAERPDLAARIAASELDDLLADLDALAEPISQLRGELPAISRDRDDDYLIAHAIAASADYLVSWDKDLLVPGTVDGLSIVSPPEFLRILREAGRASAPRAGPGLHPDARPSAGAIDTSPHPRYGVPRFLGLIRAIEQWWVSGPSAEWGLHTTPPSIPRRRGTGTSSLNDREEE